MGSLPKFSLEGPTMASLADSRVLQELSKQHFSCKSTANLPGGLKERKILRLKRHEMPSQASAMSIVDRGTPSPNEGSRNVNVD